jgi:hypothetical protein
LREVGVNVEARASTVCGQPFGRALALVLALAALGHALILSQAWSENPLVTTTQGDAAIYWTWAERIAAGEWIGAEPFHVPPLYAYALGALRAAGGGLLAAYVGQLLLHLGTTAWVALLGRRAGGAVAGLVAAVLYACSEDATFFVQRISPPTCQAFLIAWTWWEWGATEPRWSVGRASRAGVALGLAALANPVMLAGALVLFAWAFFRTHRGTFGAGRAALALGACVLTIAPAPLANALAAGEFVPVSTQGGLAFEIGRAHV